MVCQEPDADIVYQLLFRRLAVHRFHLDEREIAFAVLRNADFTFHGVAGMEIESADLGGRDIDVIRAGATSSKDLDWA